MMSQSVKADFEDGVQPQRTEIIQQSGCEETAVGVNLGNADAPLCASGGNVQKVGMKHRFTAGERECLNAAGDTLVQQCHTFFPRKFRHQGRIVRSHKTVAAVKITFACNRPVQRREIAIVAKARALPISQGLLATTRFYQTARCQGLEQRAFLVLTLPVAAAKQFKLLGVEAHGIARAIPVIRVGYQPPGTQGDIVFQSISHVPHPALSRFTHSIVQQYASGLLHSKRPLS